MTFSFELPLLVLLLLTAGAALIAKDLLSATLVLGSYSFFLALVWAWLGAVDVAFVEAVVGSGLATVFFLLTLFNAGPDGIRFRRASPPLAAVIVLPVLAGLMLYSAVDLPQFGDPAAPASVHVSPEYLQRAYPETLTTNVVTAVLMDYRALDTLVETVVVFTSGIACWLLLRRDPQ